MKNKIKFICAIDSVYSLYLYLILYQQNFDRTLFVYSDGIAESISSNLIHRIHVRSYKNKKFSSIRRFISAIVLKYCVLPRYFKSGVECYGQDHLFYSFAVLRKKFTLLEDGLGNYVNHKPTLQSRIRECLLGGKEWGYSAKAEKIILTGIKKTPVELNDKVEIIDINHIWQSKSENDKFAIRKIFNIDFSLKSDPESKVAVLLTQPFSEDGAIDEQQKIDIYRKILCNYNYDIIIKPHPRETTNYFEYFPNCIVLPGSFPFQLVAQDFNPLRVITCFSTIMYNGANVLKHVHGTKMSKQLTSYYGVYLEEFDDFA